MFMVTVETEVMTTERNPPLRKAGSGWTASLLAGLVLLSSVAINLLKPLADSTASVYPPALVFYANQVELALGLWLLLGRARRTAWVVAVLLFGNFAILNTLAIWNGQSDCGCFGAVKVNPWITLGLNSVVLGLLLWKRPASEHGMFLPILAGLIIAVFLGAGALVAHGDTGTKLLARWKGDFLLLQPAVLDFGEGTVGQKVTKQVVISNLTDQPIRLIGGTNGCSCTATEGLPVDVPANGQVTLDIHLTFKGTVGEFSHPFEYLTNTNKQPKLPGKLIGRVAADNP
jgi:hypothetical protein